MPSRDKLEQFVTWCDQHITGDEKGQAQIFLDRLFQAFGQPGSLDVGGEPEFRVRKADADGGGTAFADYVWKPVVLVEMKKRGEKLQRHYRQAFDYWTRLVPHRPRYVVLCNFDEFCVYDFDTDLDTPKDTLALKDLPERWGPLAFLAPGNPRPTFDNDREKVTREAADCLAECFRKFVRRGVPQPDAQRFILQMLVALFAEDIDLLPKYFVAQLLEECTTPADGYDLIGGLFEAMNSNPPKAGGRFKGVRYFNGGLFREPARLELQDLELVLLRKAAKFDWSKVQPEIFGTLFQHSMNDAERHAFGAHFTHPSDIMKIVKPTITDPWTEQIEGAKTRTRLNQLLDRMHTFRVLDPACGSGNFLYIAYREMKRLEARIFERLRTEFKTDAKEAAQMPLSYLSAQNFYGLDVLPFAVEIAKVTMMIGRKLAIDELHISEPPLPLDNLDHNFIAADALLTPEGQPTQWPQADVIIGNPPFLDARKMTMEHGREYVGKLEKNYPEVPRRADLCTYWFRKAADHLPACTTADPLSGRGGLVGTQNIRNNESREGGLDHVVSTGAIVEAVENQPWSGEANVNVSIANWMKTQDAASLPKKRKLWFKIQPSASVKKTRKRGSGSATKEYELDARECDQINSALSDATDVAAAKILKCNTQPKCVFEGVQTGHDGFVISAAEANDLLAIDEHKPYVKPFINGSDLLSARYVTKPEYVVDLSNLNVLQTSALPRLLAIPKERVLKDWEKNAAQENKELGRDRGEHQNRLDTWWALKRPRNDLQQALKKLPRYVACSAVMKRPTFVFISANYLPTNALKVFAFADDYSFGVLQSDIHWLWFITKCSKLTERFRYTPESVFDTFPWPQFEMGSAPAPGAADRALAVGTGARASNSTSVSAQSSIPLKGCREGAATDTRGACTPQTIAKIDAVASASRTVRRVRAEALQHLKGGLRALYRTLELPGANPLKDAHAALDAAVLDAYGFSAKQDLLAQLLELNLTVAARIERGEPVTAPGVPPGYPTPQSLVTDDCIQPP
ncbi:MAG: N-6 DNA methylase [Verrucomicrobiae bacterium]|nr:N-6 DNA methylase [Verrucomicrobiae bacterium]